MIFKHAQVYHISSRITYISFVIGTLIIPFKYKDSKKLCNVINHISYLQKTKAVKFILRLPQCTTDKSDGCFWFIHSLLFHNIFFFLFGDDVEIMWKLSDGIRLVTSELAVRSCDCVAVTHTVPQKPISHWSHMALFSWSQHIANQQRQMCRMQDEGCGR